VPLVLFQELFNEASLSKFADKNTILAYLLLGDLYPILSAFIIEQKLKIYMITQ
jgi:hypothetical protein